MLASMPTIAVAQSKGVDQPDNYSKIEGKYILTVSADPTEVKVEEPITLRVYITALGAKFTEPDRKHLRLFPEEWKNDFYVEELLDRHEVMREKRTWLFVYRLKPKHTRVEAIDDIKLVYYDSDLPGMRKYVTKFAERIPIKVSPKPDESGKVESDRKATPDSFLAMASAREVLSVPTQPLTFSERQLILIITLPPLVCLGVIVLWRRYFPDVRQRALQLRSASAQRALTRLNDSASPPWDVVRDYLHERFGFEVEDATTDEVWRFLNRFGFAWSVCGQGRSFVEKCDEVRFNLNAAPPSCLTEAASQLIHALEADPCARR